MPVDAAAQYHLKTLAEEGADSPNGKRAIDYLKQKGIPIPSLPTKPAEGAQAQAEGLSAMPTPAAPPAPVDTAKEGTSLESMERSGRGGSKAAQAWQAADETRARNAVTANMERNISADAARTNVERELGLDATKPITDRATALEGYAKKLEASDPKKAQLVRLGLQQLQQDFAKSRQ